MRSSSFIFTVLVSLLNLQFTEAAPASIWRVDILTSPAPPPEEGPPLSAGALRDKSKLKFEVIGIAGAYLVWLLGTLVLLLFVGKRYRRKTQTSNRTLSMEIVKPAPLSSHPGMSIEQPLKSPGKMASLKSWASGGRSHSHKHSNVSVATTIDATIIEADRVRNMDEMAKLYAAVMVHDEERSQREKSSSQTTPKTPSFPLTPRSTHTQMTLPPTPRSPPAHMTLPASPRSPYHRPDWSGQGLPISPRSPQYPPEFQHLRNTSSDVNRNRPEPTSGRLSHPMAPTPVDNASLRTVSQTSTRKFKASPLSLASTRVDSANQNKRRPSNISIRGQPISQPMGSATFNETYSEEAIDSARTYNPGPPPPTPGQKSITSTIYEVEPTWRQEQATPSSSVHNSGTASSSVNNLPFRQFYGEALRSAPPTKTTFLEKRESILGVHPKTGMPQTPYSPYTPFTPMTPITPRHLVSKEERKRNKKKEGLKVLCEDDLVANDDDMWGK